MRGSVGRAGAYPIADPGAQDGWIPGALFEVVGGREVWRVLDLYEGCCDPEPEYARKLVDVWFGRGWCGRWITAWSYIAPARGGSSRAIAEPS